MEAGVAEAGRSADFADFFRAEHETLLRAMYLVTGDRHEAEDLAQSAFVRVCEKWDRVQRMQNPSGYLYRTAVNAQRSRLRRVGAGARHVFASVPPDPISASDDRDRIRRALATLPVSQREAIVLVEWLGMTDVEAGEVLRVSPVAVRVRISRGKASLRLLLERAPA